MKMLTPKKIKVFKTCNLYLSFFVLGLCVALPGPTLLDLQSIVNTDTKHIAFIYTARSLGYLLGSLIGGIAFDLIKKKQILLTVFSFAASITMLIIPWSRSIGILTAFMVLNGFSIGVIDTGGNVCCLNLWGKDSAPFFQALHLSFGVGGLVAPLIAAPFLGNFEGIPELLNNSTTIFLNRTTSRMSFNMSMNTLSTATTISTIPTVTFAYTAVGSFAFLVAILFLIISLISPSDECAKKTDCGQLRKRSRQFVLTIVILNMLLVFMETGTEIGYAQMLTTYTVKGALKLPKTVGSYMTSAFWASFTISRLVTVFAAIKLSNLTLIIFDLIVTSIGATILFFLGATYEWSLWLATVLLGIGIASFFPATIGWLDGYINITNKIASSFTVGAAFGEMVVPYIISYYIEEIPEILLYVVPASCIFSAAIGTIMFFILRNKESKYLTDEGTDNTAYNEDVKI